MNQFVWNLRYPESERMEGMILWNGFPGGILAPPGEYSSNLKPVQIQQKVTLHESRSEL